MFSGMFKNIFLIIEIYDKYCMVHAWTVSSQKVIKKIKKKFFYDKKNKTPDVMLNFIYDYTKKYSQSYLATILNSSNQRTLLEDTASKKFLKTLHETNISIQVDPKWRVYVPSRDIEKLKKEFQPLIFDLIISPISILHHLYRQGSKDDGHIYILALPYTVCIAVFKGTVAVTSVTLSLLTDENTDTGDQFDFVHPDDIMEDEFEIDSEVQKRDLELEDEGFAIEDQDNITIKEEDDEDTTVHASSDLGDELIKNIQYVIEQFYGSPYYHDDNDLIGSIVIFNQDIFTAQLRAQLREEMMLEIFHKEINVIETISTMMIQDIS